MYQGILLILARQPYDIGDKVCFMDANADVDDFGPPSGGWIVENVDLYTTTVRLGTTREYATFTNSSIANSRILNLKRSEKPNVYMYLKFTMNITKEQLDEFRRRITEFIKDRPREWIKLVSLRCTHFETDQQYLKFALIVQHRESWQSFATIQVSKSHVYLHALHLQKELKMNYTAPDLPVHLTGVPPKALVRNFLSSDGNGNNEVVINPSQFPFESPSLDNEAKLQEAVKDSPFKNEQVGQMKISTTAFNTGAARAIDGSLVRRKGSRSSNIDASRDLFEDSSNSQPTRDIEESIRPKGSPNVSSSTVSGAQAMFVTDAQREWMKNKDM